MRTVTEKLTRMRKWMHERGITAYVVPTDDCHCSEYVGAHFQCRAYLTGFTGSAGTAVILKDRAGLWTDGRYFLQAEEQLKGSGITLYRAGEPGVPTVDEFLAETLQEGEILGFDGTCMQSLHGEKLEKLLREKNGSIRCSEDAFEEIWEDRPPLSADKVWSLPLCYAGESRADKLRRIREKMAEAGGDHFLLTSLEDIAWLLNLRGSDIRHCPVFLSFLLMTPAEVRCYLNPAILSEELKTELENDGVRIFPYAAVYEDAALLSPEDTLILDKENVNYLLLTSIPDGVRVLDQQNLTLLPKAIKNPVEIENMREAHRMDGVAVIKFLYWLKKNIGTMRITELSASDRLLSFRQEQEHFLDNSFEPILAYGKHAAIVHYSPTEETDLPLEPRGLLLADTGGHYLEGSTDITRTIVLGETTEEERRYFTTVLRGTLRLGAAKFRYGCTGLNLDYLARAPLWELGEDYNHGTGHGVGYLLSIHEGPNSIRWKGSATRPCAVLEEGMITSDEPGYYRENAFGIRHENVILCRKAEKTAFGQFMEFEHLTMVPFDLDAVEPSLMSAGEKELLNSYHRKVYERTAPFLTEEERIWLKHATREIE